MREFLRSIFDTSFMPHGGCYFWIPGLVWLHVVSDSLIALSYYSIPITLLSIVRKKPDIPYRWVFLMFGAFIMACGTSHLMEVITVYIPVYWISGGVKAITAILSVATAIALIPMAPKALALHGSQELEKINRALAEEVERHKRSEEQFREGEEQYHTLADGAKEYAIFMLDPEGRVLSWNSGAERINGYKAEEIIHQSIECFYTEEDRANGRVASLLRTAAKAGRTEDQGWHLRKDGSRFWADVAITALKYENGKLRGFAKLTRDITDRRKEELKFRGLLEAAPDAMVIINPVCKIVLLNAQAEKLFGYSREELYGQPMDLLVPESCQALHPIQQVGHFRDPHQWPLRAPLELNARRKNGPDFPSETIFSPMETGEDLLVTAVIRDVTERKRHGEELESLRQRAEEANRLKSEFLANMSHELRTPLNSMIGFSELIHDGKAGPVTTDQKEYLGDVLSSAHHLSQLINDILDLAKVEAGKIEFRPEEILLDALVKEVCGSLRTVAEGKKIDLSVDVDAGLNTVRADPARLKQVLYNYLSNALKFTPDNGKVQVRAQPEGKDHFRISVEDTGVGIAAEDQGRLFMAFQQLDASASKKFQGTGLGLALCKKIVEAQGGRVGVDSLSGRGAVFYVVLPREPRETGPPV